MVSLYRVVEFAKDTLQLKEYLLLADNTPVTLHCVQPKGETVNILQRYSGDTGVENLIVNNSILNTQFLEEYGYTFNESTDTNSLHNLTIRRVSNVFNDFIYHCVGRPSGREVTLKLLVQDLPHCKYNFEDPVFFENDEGKLFQMTCDLKTKRPFVDMNIKNTLMSDHLRVTKTSNNTHKTERLEMEIDKSWNRSEFYCNISFEQHYRFEIAEPRAKFERACHFGPVQFYEKLQTYESLQSPQVTYFDEGDTISFTCNSNIPIAKKSWEVRTFPAGVLDIDQKESGDTLRLHIKFVVQNIQTLRVEAICTISFRERQTFSKFEAVFRKKKGTEDEFVLVKIALLVVACTTLSIVCLGIRRRDR